MAAKTKNQQLSTVQITIALITGFLSALFAANSTGGGQIESATVSREQAKRVVSIITLLIGVSFTVAFAIASYVLVSVSIDTANMWLYLASFVALFLTAKAVITTIKQWRTLA